MATEYPLININQLDLDALSEYMIQKNKLVYRKGDDVAADTNSQDVDEVGGISAANIARAANSYENDIDLALKNSEELDEEYPFLWTEGVNDETKKLLAKRNTVRNSARLGGMPASNYMTLARGNTIDTVQQKMIAAYNTEIRDLKEELYTLRSELQRNNVVDYNGFYNGFSDGFSCVKYRNIQDAVGTITVSGFNGQKSISVSGDEADIIKSFD